MSADFEQDGATALLGAGGRLVRTLGALLDAVLLFRGHTVLHTPSAFVEQDNAGLVMRLRVVALLITLILVKVNA